MKEISIQNSIEKSRVASEVPYLLFVEIAVPADRSITGEELVIPLVKNNEDVVYKGVTYTALPMRIDIKNESGGLPSVTLSIDDVKGVVRSYMEQYGGGVGFDVRIFAQFTNAFDFDPDFDEEFEVVVASAPDYTASFTLGAENPLTMPFPKRKFRRDTCEWTWGDENCRYSGSRPGPCDYTLQGDNGCAKFENSMQFSGHPGINNSGIRYGRAR